MNLQDPFQRLGLRWMYQNHRKIIDKGAIENWGIDQIISELCDGEIQQREQQKKARLLNLSKLDTSKSIDKLDLTHFSTKLRRQIDVLLTGEFVDNATNVLAFGLPGRGKTHIVTAIGIELTQKGYRVLFRTSRQLVEELLKAKASLKLAQELKKLDTYDVVICDDIGYLEHTREEMEVFFAFLSERYERRSIMITSNLVFSEWEKIFKDAMTTAAAIDRMVHHSVLLEVKTERSYREYEAEINQRTEEEQFNKVALRNEKRPKK